MPEQVFVARDSELKRLQTFLDHTLAGQAQVCFVTGDAGAGKSAMLAEFARRAEVADEKLVVALDECNAQTGLGDPFLPFREILAELTGDTETKVAGGKITKQNAARLSNFVHVSGRSLIEVAPDIIGILIPGAQIVAKAAKFGAEKAGWLSALEKKAAAPPTKLNENMIFQQIANLLVALAKEQPLLLILDDLQWADNASIALLFHLSRTLKDAHVLIIGAYRPSDVALGRDGARHPLEAALNEIKRYRGDVLIDLNESAETDRKTFVEALIDSEPNHLSAEFRAALFAHTDGYPLFTVELLRTMQERGDLVWDGDMMDWRQHGEIDWEALPARVEGVIEARIGRLTENLHDILTAASVEGMQFTTQVVARVRAVTERDLLKNLSDELEGRHHLVKEGGEEKIGKARLWHYHFGHILFQKYLYDNISRGERRLMHADVAGILEELYGERADTIAVQLARHYEEAGEDEKAAHYYQRAGEQAAAVYGNAEAVRLFTRALELVPEDDLSARYELVQARERVYGLRSEGAAQLADIEALERLSERLNDDQRRAQAALRRANYSFDHSEYVAALNAAEKAVAWAQKLGDSQLEIEGRLRLGETYARQLNVVAAQAQFEQTLALSRTLNERRLEADSLLGLGHLAHNMGNLDLSRSHLEQALGIARDLSDRFRQAIVLADLCKVAGHVNDWASVKLYGDQALHISREIGYRPAEGPLLVGVGYGMVWGTDFEQAQPLLEEGLRLAREVGDRWNENWALLELAILAKRQGDYSRANEYLAERVRVAHETGDPLAESSGSSELISVLARVGDYDRARAALETALQFSRSIGNRAEEGWSLGQGSLISQQEGQYQTACDQARAALTIAEAIGNRDMEQFGQDVLGHALVGLGQLDEAVDAYHRALAIQRELKQLRNVADTLAGLARVAIAQGDVPAALKHVEEILTIGSAQIANADEPVRVNLTCYQVLNAAHDPRAEQILKTSYDSLQANAAKISDESVRRMFVQNVPYNRDLIAAWQAYSER